MRLKNCVKFTIRKTSIIDCELVLCALDNIVENAIYFSKQKIN